MKINVSWINFSLCMGYTILFFVSYFAAITGIYCSILLTQGVIFENIMLNDFQHHFYYDSGYRKIWQAQKECVEFDKHLIYKPKKGRCEFNNAEFATSLNFNEQGRMTSFNPSKAQGVVVLGDSFAMGWGVSDDETFSAVLQKKLDRPAYNLAVSSYGTRRELMRLEASGLMTQVDTIVIQLRRNSISLPMMVKQDTNSGLFVEKISAY